MARGLVTSPAFLLLDEPTSSLDQETKERTQNLILSEQQRLANGLVVVTHDTEEAAYLGETILLVQEHQIHQIKTQFSTKLTAVRRWTFMLFIGIEKKMRGEVR